MPESQLVGAKVQLIPYNYKLIGGDGELKAHAFALLHIIAKCPALYPVPCITTGEQLRASSEHWRRQVEGANMS